MDRLTITLAPGGEQKTVEMGTPLSSVAPKIVKDPKTGKEYPVLAALVDNKVKTLSFKLFYPHTIEFIGYNHPEGRRTYLRSLCFLAQRAVRSLLPGKVFKINHSLPSGMYCKLRGEHIPDADVIRLRDEMRRLVEADLPFTHKSVRADEGGRRQLLWRAGAVDGLSEGLRPDAFPPRFLPAVSVQ